MPAKQSSSKKLARSARNRTRPVTKTVAQLTTESTEKPYKKVKRVKRTGKGVQRVAEGQDLASQLKDDRNNRYYARRDEKFIADFIETLTVCLLNDAKVFDWDGNTCSGVVDYVESLVKGNGIDTAGLADKVVARVQVTFATVYLYKEPRTRFPAQAQKWFSGTLEKVTEQREQAKNRKAKQPQAAKKPAPKPTFKERFIARLHNDIAKAVSAEGWSTDRTQTSMQDYATYLVRGTGTPPSLTGRPREKVQTLFVQQNLDWNIRDNSFVGQSQDWFAEALQQERDRRVGKPLLTEQPASDTVSRTEAPSEELELAVA